MHATGLASKPPGQLVHENVARFKNFYPDEVLFSRTAQNNAEGFATQTWRPPGEFPTLAGGQCWLSAHIVRFAKSDAKSGLRLTWVAAVD